MKFTVAWLLINLWLNSIAINFNFNTFIYCITFLYLPFPASRAQVVYNNYLSLPNWRITAWTILADLKQRKCLACILMQKRMILT